MDENSKEDKLWDCPMCGGKKCMTGREYKGQPAGVCTCSKCGNTGLFCPLDAYKGPPGSPAIFDQSKVISQGMPLAYL